MIRAMDISKQQGAFDPEKAKAQGIETVILRAGYAESRDPKFKTFAADCEKAGLRTGAYLFMTWHYRQNNGGDPAVARAYMEQQVDALLETLQGSGVTSWVALTQQLEKNYTVGLSPKANTQLLNEAAARVRAAGYIPCVYASADWLKNQMFTSRLTMPVWAAYHYRNDKAPDFDEAGPLRSVSTDWGRYLLGLGEQLCGWQFCSLGHGPEYGAKSADVNRDWLYHQPEDMVKQAERQMGFEFSEGKELVVTSPGHPACEAFVLPDVNAGSAALPLDSRWPITAEGPTQWAGGMKGRWLKIRKEEKELYVLALPDRCRMEEMFENPIRITGRGSAEQLAQALSDYIREVGA